MTRPGIGLYGGAPYEQAEPVVHLSLPVIQIRDVAEGETVGYGNSWSASSPARIATVAAGYADGLLRALSNKASLVAPRPGLPHRGTRLNGYDWRGCDSLAATARETLDILCPLSIGG